MNSRTMPGLMKSTDASELTTWEQTHRMKPKQGSPRKNASNAGAPMWNSRLPMEWMDPMSWRLPSGKALAEFALQAGFLAPLMIGARPFPKKKPMGKAGAADAGGNQQWGEGPGASGTFRETR
jgi:hypothetical protein